MKAQVFSYDFFLSFLVFSSVLLILFAAVINLQEDVFGKVALERATNIANLAIDQLVTRPGIPENWSAENVESIGIASSEYFLNWTKVKRLNQTGYEIVRAKLTRGYDFFLSIQRINGSKVLEKGFSFENRTRIKVMRVAVLNESMVKVYLTVFS